MNTPQKRQNLPYLGLLKFLRLQWQFYYYYTFYLKNNGWEGKTYSSPDSDCSRRWSFMFFPKSFQNLSLNCKSLLFSSFCLSELQMPQLISWQISFNFNCFNKATIWIYLSLFVVDNADVHRYKQQIKTKNINIGSFEAI